MRTIFLLRGAPGSGKSTWIANNELEPYTLCADNIRTMMQSPVLTKEGRYVISQRNDRQVWELLFKLLEQRMGNGEFVIIDATHYKRELLNKYVKLIQKYRYRAYVVDFTDVPKETCLERNKNRASYKYVPEEAIEKMYAVFEAEKNVQIKSCFKQISKEDALQMLSSIEPFDFSKWEKVIVFGDIHGCYEPIKTYFEKHPYNEKYMYIFCGDYIDRGLQNKEVLEFMIEFSKKDNVLCLEGNHESWLRLYSSKDEYDFNKIKSKEFIEHTIPQIQSLDKADIRDFCRRLGQYAYFEYSHITWLVTHGGLPCLPILKTSTSDMIKGVGKYEDVDAVHKTFRETYTEMIRQIHGHRNVMLTDITQDDQNYNLNSEIEYGEDLKIMEISLKEYPIPFKGPDDDPDIRNEIEFINEPNPIHRERPKQLRELFTISNNEIISNLNKDKHIIKKKLEDDIISYSFDRDVFFKREWNEVNTKARGLFCRGDNIIARSYDKFFNLSERRETEPIELRKNLQFPVTAYLKENGFLGLVSYDFDKDKVFIASKSTNVGEFADIVREQFYKLPRYKEIIEWLKAQKDNPVTMIFEVIDPIKDPHIIEYEEAQMILLDVIYNTFKTKYVAHNDLLKLCKYFGMTAIQNELFAGFKGGLDIPFKKIRGIFKNYTELVEFIESFESRDGEYRNSKIEGFVFRDANNFQFKYKTPFYKKWKYFRAIKYKYARETLKQIFKDKDEVEFVNWLKVNYADNLEELNKKSIIDIRKEIEK